MCNIREFFDNLASDWDRRSNHEYIEDIIRKIDIHENSKILDVACGTGILEEYLLKYNPKEILGVDISKNMIEIAKEKNNDKRVEYLCEDIFNIEAGEWDFIIVFNAFPHFIDKEKFLSHLSKLLKKGRKLIICHNFGRKSIDKIHENMSKSISSQLISGKELVKITPVSLKEKLVIDNDKIYLVILDYFS
ncbi:class I SAM-dependent methyltransferase [Clostridium sardiniense]|uniref:class I SAM-dependent methyltransferase n=1 Tax=Clostridium sardiniense TaxID=29369 RepID=UPI003D353F1D